MSEVSIILASYNGEKVICNQLDSVFNQTFNDITVYVCDDGSQDRTLACVHDYAKAHPEYDLHVCPNKQNLGYTLNFLNGIKLVNSPYFMFCDQDDIWNKDKIEKTLELMKETEAGDVSLPVTVFTDSCIYDVKTQTKVGSFHQLGKLDTKKLDFASLLMENKCNGCTMMMNNAVKERLTQLPEHARVHDWWIALLCSSQGKISYLPEMTMLYCQYGTNMIGSNTFGSYFKKRIAALREQKKVLKKTILQAKEFCDIYEGELSEQNVSILHAFCQLYDASKVKKIKLIRHYGFTKTGFLRNMGLYFLI